MVRRRTGNAGNTAFCSTRPASEEKVNLSPTTWVSSYNNRSEAIRDILRSALAQEATQQHGTQGFAVLSYVYEHEKRDLASRIVSTQHHHHDLSVATLHVHINHDDCLEIAVLKGDMGDVQHFADDVIAQRGVRHGHLQCLPKED